MKINKINRLLISAFCFFIALWADIHGMEQCVDKEVKFLKNPSGFYLDSWDQGNPCLFLSNSNDSSNHLGTHWTVFIEMEKEIEPQKQKSILETLFPNGIPKDQLNIIMVNSNNNTVIDDHSDHSDHSDHRKLEVKLDSRISIW